MSVLRLVLAGPMQSWGTQSRFGVRDTEKEPTKSGVLGLICSALGRERSASLDDLVTLRQGIRVDREGRLCRDFHTAQNFLRASGVIADETVLSSRYYLADAVFLVGLEGESGLLGQVDAALRSPRWTLFLGRKSFVPGSPVAWPKPTEAILPGTLADVLRQTPSLVQDKEDDLYRFVFEVPRDQGEPRMDVPVSFEQRLFTVRYVRTEFNTIQAH